MEHQKTDGANGGWGDAFAINARHLVRQRAWSYKAFGPSARTFGILDHIRRELAEVAAAHQEFERERAIFRVQWDSRARPDLLHKIMGRVVTAHAAELGEWVDVIILALDGALRSGADPQEILDAVLAKQAANEARPWPDWRTMSEEEAIEHVRDTGDADSNVVENPQQPSIGLGQIGGLMLPPQDPEPERAVDNIEYRTDGRGRVIEDEPDGAPKYFNGVPLEQCDLAAPHRMHTWLGNNVNGPEDALCPGTRHDELHSQGD